MLRRMFALGLAMLLLGGCMASGGPATTTSGPIQISDAWVRPMLGPDGAEHGGHPVAAPTTGAESGAVPQPTGDAMAGMGDSSVASTAYMTIRNTGSAPDRLLNASTDAATSVELHDTQDKSGVMSMQQVMALDIPADNAVELKPTGLHMMLVGLKHDLNSGTSVTITLSFEKAGAVTVQAAVRDQ